MSKTVPNIHGPIIEAYIESIRPDDPEIRKELDFTYSFDGKEAILYGVRPVYNDPKRTLKLEFAKIKFNGTKKEWNLSWMRASGRWEASPPLPRAKTLETIIGALKEDAIGSFPG